MKHVSQINMLVRRGAHLYIFANVFKEWHNRNVWIPMSAFTLPVVECCSAWRRCRQFIWSCARAWKPSLEIPMVFSLHWSQCLERQTVSFYPSLVGRSYKSLGVELVDTLFVYFVQLILESCILQDTFWLLDMSLHLWKSCNLILKMFIDINRVQHFNRNVNKYIIYI